MILGLDFETRSSTSPKLVGADAYAAHPSTTVLCAVFGLSSGPGKLEHLERWYPGQDLPAWAHEHIVSGLPVVAHNAGFERAICRYVVTGWPEIPVEQWIDTMALAAAASLPRSLAGVGAALGCEVQKDDEGHDLMKILCVADNPEPTPEQLERLAQYCEIDVRAMIEIYWRLPKQGLREAAIRRADAVINERGFAVDTDLVRGMQAIVRTRKSSLAKVMWDSTGDLIKPTAVPPLIRWLEEQNITVPVTRKKRPDGTIQSSVSLDRASIVTLLAEPGLPAEVRAVLNARLEGSKLTSLSKLQAVTNRLSPDGRLRGALLYHGAHTGRWSSMGFQVHNLPKCKLKDKLDPMRSAILTGSYEQARSVVDDVLAGLSQSLRSTIVAPEGKVLLGADYNAIEARVLAWLAGQQDVLDIFAAGRDIYMEDANRIGSQDRDGIGKCQRLGLGYGMGAVQFISSAASFGITLEPKEARRIVKLWREANGAIVQMWRDIEDAFKTCIKDPKAKVRVGSHLEVRGSRACVQLILPSGRALHYWRPSIQTRVRRIKVVDEDGSIKDKEVELQEIRFFTGDWHEMVEDTTYAGKLAENATQAVARDVMGSAIVALESYDLPVVVHVHDCIIAEVDESKSDPDFFRAVLERPATWCRDLPMVAKPYTSKYFRG